MFPSYRSQSIDLRCKSIDWFLYEGNTGTYGLNNSKMMFNASISSCWKCFSLVDYRCFRNWIETYLLDKIMLDGKSKIRVAWYLQTSNLVAICFNNNQKKKLSFCFHYIVAYLNFFIVRKAKFSVRHTFNVIFYYSRTYFSRLQKQIPILGWCDVLKNKDVFGNNSHAILKL